MLVPSLMMSGKSGKKWNKSEVKCPRHVIHICIVCHDKDFWINSLCSRQIKIHVGYSRRGFRILEFGYFIDSRVIYYLSNRFLIMFLNDEMSHDFTSVILL